MPIIKSAKKRVKVAAKAGARNSKTKRNMREAIKAYLNAIEGGKAADIAKAEKAAVSAIDTAAKKAVIHKNKAARKKAQLSAAAKASGVKITKAAAKKPAPKTPVKRVPAKKPTAKTRKTSTSRKTSS